MHKTIYIVVKCYGTLAITVIESFIVAEIERATTTSLQLFEKNNMPAYRNKNCCNLRFVGGRFYFMIPRNILELKFIRLFLLWIVTIFFLKECRIFALIPTLYIFHFIAAIFARVIAVSSKSGFSFENFSESFCIKKSHNSDRLSSIKCWKLENC